MEVPEDDTVAQTPHTVGELPTPALAEEGTAQVPAPLHRRVMLGISPVAEHFEGAV
jgi:hypothetical protein